MNMHTPFTHDQIALMLQEPFALHCRIPGLIQEEIGKRMAKDAPRPARVDGAHLGGAAYSAASQARRHEKSADVIAAYLDGTSTKIIAKQLHMGQSVVLRILRENGVPTRPIGARPQRQERAQEVLRMAEQGATVNAIKIALKMGPATVRRILKEAQQ